MREVGVTDPVTGQLVPFSYRPRVPISQPAGALIARRKFLLPMLWAFVSASEIKRLGPGCNPVSGAEAA